MTRTKMTHRGNRSSDFWKFLARLLKTQTRYLFLQLLPTAPQELRQALQELFEAFAIEWTYRILKALHEGSCIRSEIAARLFPGENDPRHKLRRKQLDLALEHLLTKGYIIERKEGAKIIYSIAERYEEACEAIFGK